MKLKDYAPLLHEALKARGDCYALTLHPHFEACFGIARQRACFFEHAKHLCGGMARTFSGASRRDGPNEWLHRLPDLFLIAESKGRLGGDAGYHAHGLAVFRPEHGDNVSARFRALLRRDWGEDAQPDREAFEEDLIERTPVPSLDFPRFSRIANRHHRPSFDLTLIPDQGWLAYGFKNAGPDYELLTVKALFGR